MGNTCLTSFMISYITKELSLSALVLIPLSKNGVAERKNRHLLDVVRILLLESSVPSKFWVDALSTAIYLINKLPSQVLNFDSPYYRLYHQHPSYLNLHTFGCV